jgi:hypothetical protein
MKDAKGRQGYIASNFQFQFDGPPQAGAIYTSGFSVCGNSSIALGPSTVFYQCRSGSFYNLYNENWAPQCESVALDVIPCEVAGSTPTAAPVASQSVDGQPEGTTVLTQLSDAQPNGPSAIPVSQYSDGQPQMPSALLSQLSDAQPIATGTGSAPTPSSNATLASATPTVPIQTGAATIHTLAAQAAAVAVGIAGLALL